MDDIVRCEWAVQHPELLDYHDNVWGVPTRDDREIFAAYGQCVLHAGLLWTAMLKKRPVFAAAFDDWDVVRIAEYDGTDVERLMHTEGMMRNLQKITCVIKNAQRYLEVQREFGSFAEYVWGFTDNLKLSEDLRSRGFKFAGPASAYGLMQDIGIINSHDPSCFRYDPDRKGVRRG